VPTFSLVLRRALPGPAWLAAAISGFATLGVAAFPLHVSVAFDRLHGTFATLGYIALASVPLFAARALSHQGRRNAAIVSVAVSAVSVLCLAATPIADANGLFQRLGLTVVDAWLCATAVGLPLAGEVDVRVDAVGHDVGVE
jgi:4-hydroxybenzoate polyprenyltransferase